MSDWFAGLTAGLGVLIRVLRPFVTEILILEKAPWRRKPNHEISFGKRSQAMHGSIGGETISIGLVMLFFSAPLLASFYGTLSNAFELLGIPREVAWVHSGISGNQRFCWSPVSGPSSDFCFMWKHAFSRKVGRSN